MAIELAGQVAEAGTLVNLCASRLGFLVTWLAALRAGKPMLLPSAGHRERIDALRDCKSPWIVVDESHDIDSVWPSQARCFVRAAEPSGARLRDGGVDTRIDVSWQPSWDSQAAVLYTSGSTGRPEAHRKTLLQLALGALALGERLWPRGGPGEFEQLVSSVTPAHMFGFEACVMLPLVYGLPVSDERPLLAADMAHLAASSSRPFLWVTTPLHLQNLVRSGTALRHCSAALCSTMPLSPGVAEQAEALLGTHVLELYGSTETGAFATRRTAHDAEWSALTGVFFKPDRQPSGSGEPTVQATSMADLDSLGDAQPRHRGEAPVAFGAHFDSPVRLADRIEVAGSGRFTLLGRDTDLLKIAGHRASLANLNLLLLEMPGLLDGMLFMPDPAVRGCGRLCLVYSSQALDRSAIERWWRQRVAPVFMPRAFIRVDRMPRNELGKVTRASLDGLYADWLARQGRFDVSVPTGHPALAGHFPGRPLVPGVLLLDAMLTGMTERTGRSVDAVEQARFTSPWLPEEVATVRFEIEAERCRMSAVTVRFDRDRSEAMPVELVRLVARLADPAQGLGRSPTVTVNTAFTADAPIVDAEPTLDRLACAGAARS